jgi:polyisoprenoid-binding protein YceI
MATTRKPLLIGAIVAVVVLVAAGAATWYFVFRDDAPEAVSIDAAAESAEEEAEASGDTAPIDSVDGTWSVIAGDGADTSTFVGYRVQEELANVGAKTAVGRTPAVTGTLEIDGTTIAVVDVEADLTQLASDESGRDGQMRSQALETTAFPSATFTLTEPIELDAVPAEGERISTTGTGDLTIHGATNSVDVTLEAELVGSRIVVTGTAPIVFADYDIEKPQSFRVLSIEDNGEMEFQLFFVQG